MTVGENAPTLLHSMPMMQVPVCYASQIKSVLGDEAPFLLSVSTVSTCPLYVLFPSGMKPVVQNILTNFWFVFGMVHQENFSSIHNDTSRICIKHIYHPERL
jgi:hypothetical protein